MSNAFKVKAIRRTLTSEYYVELGAHKARIRIAVLNAEGKPVMVYHRPLTTGLVWTGMHHAPVKS